ncbi:hypothetical protein K504DRAFT_384935 [Pleomassaria siparia CBS 279.74]|uniref:Zn(2)-C6 fungal-type domain-containing protein n=1 Tax=Pleomassaria siparia CBS 279.74 TaxID=1314801 RepID=A0A6G1K2A7_9PLEO|nr:hypothetical protein K504DRAFT_384935 [Pleomassaria siparia CBS 279.74]
MVENQIERLHAACDECRARKLKCSGGSPQCGRCARENISCIYSPQKQMGRPRKRRRDQGSLRNEQTRRNPSESISINVSAPQIGDFGMISPPAPIDFSEYRDFSGHYGLSDHHHVSVLHDDSDIANAYGHEHTQHNSSMNPMIDPSLWNAQPNGTSNESGVALALMQQHETQTPCTCLSVMYLAISELQTMPTFAFPAVIMPLRRAMSTAATLLRCEKCPNEPFTAIQNVQSLTALLGALAERFHKVLDTVDDEAGRLERTGTKKLFRVSENNPATQHLHTGSVDCPMGFDIELESGDWKRLVKKAVKSEVIGGGANANPLISLVDMMEQRQHGWHMNHARMGHLDARIRMFGPQNVCDSRGNDASCLRMVAQVRSMVNHMRWD